MSLFSQSNSGWRLKSRLLWHAADERTWEVCLMSEQVKCMGSHHLKQPEARREPALLLISASQTGGKPQDQKAVTQQIQA